MWLECGTHMHIHPPPLQLTDEAVGDNPREQKTRDEHEILESDVSPLRPLLWSVPGFLATVEGCQVACS